MTSSDVSPGRPVARSTFPDRLRAAYLRNRLAGVGRPAGVGGVGSVSRGEPVLLSFAQQRLWFLEQLQPGGVAYLVPWVLRLRGRLDVAVLRRAVEELVVRHEVLRTRYAVRDGVPVQVVDEGVELDWAVVDAVGGDVDGLVRAECRQPVDLVSGPVVRVRLLRCGVREHVLVVVLHHIACDGWSVGVLARELRQLYAGFVGGGSVGLPPVGVQYADFAAWQRRWLSGEVLDRQVRFWRERLAGLAPLELPTDRPRPPVPDDSGGSVEFILPRGLGDAVRDLAHRYGATSFMALLAVYQTLLSRYCQQDDIAVGTPVAGRQRTDLQDAVGLYANAVVLRADLTADPTFADLVEQVRDTALDAFAHQDLPFERLVEELQPARDVGRNPIFQVEFVLQNVDDGGFTSGDLIAEEMLVDNHAAKFDLSLRLMERADGSLLGVLEFATALFDRTTVERMAGHFRQLLADACARPDTRVSRLRLLTPTEESTWLERASAGPPRPAPQGRLHELFRRQCRQRPDDVAVVDGGRRVTYAQLDARSAALAARLRAEGAGPGVLVGISLPRSAEVIVSILAILRTGAAYLPLDPAYPTDRIAFMTADADVRLVVTDDGGVERLPAALRAVSVSEADGDDGATDEPDRLSPGDAPAYVIYTSGSTGRPKGVMVTHQNVIDLVMAAEPLYSIGPEDTWTLFHSYAFDVSVWEMWGALLLGGRIVVVPADVAKSPADLLELVRDQRVTVLSQTPSAFRGFIDATVAHPDAPETWSLRRVVFAGEALDLAMLRPWYGRCGADGPAMVNMYGITETTVHTTCREVVPADLDGPVRSPIGRGMAGMRVMVLDRFLNPVPAGVPGEIFVGGVGVTVGYLGRPQLTAERYLPDPHGEAGQRMYRSGDRARWRSDGELEFLGRIDHQVKIRGFRVELGEIEARLRFHPDVASCAVTARDPGTGDPQLLAYVTPVPGAVLRGSELRRNLAEALPAYMLPAHVTVLSEMPITRNGKVDLAALPAPQQTRSDRPDGYLAPRTAAERLAAQVWAEVLGVSRVGVTDNFFDLGGDSIRAVRLVGRLASQGLKLSVQDLLRHQTIAQLAGAVTVDQDDLNRDRVEPFDLLPERVGRADLPDDVVDAYPPSMVQAGMLYELLADPDLRLYHNVTSYLVQDDRPLAADILHDAAEALVQRHESLRISFDLTGEEPLLRVHRAASPDLTVTDLSGLTAAEQDRAVEEYGRSERQRDLNLDRPPLMRWHAFVLSDRSWRLVVTECHAIVDGWSHNSLLTELLDAYRAERDGRPVPEHEPHLDVRIADFVVMERQTAASDMTRAFWQERVHDHERLTLPTAWGSDGGSTPFHDVRVDLSDVEDRLRALARDCSVPFKSVLLAAHVIALGVATGRRRFSTGLVCNGRPERDGGDRLTGMFLNSVPLAVDLTGRTGRAVVADVFRDEVELWPHRRYPLPLMQRHWGSGKPLLDVVFNYLDFHVLDRDTVAVEQSTDDSPNEFALHVTTEPGAMLLTARAARLDGRSADLLRRIYRAVLERLATDPDAPATVGCLPDDVRRRLLSTGNDTDVALPAHTLPDLVAAQSRATPHRTAVVSGGQRTTYAELSRAVDRIAAHLRRHGARPGVVVGVCLPRRCELVATLLAVLRTGAAYLPLDPLHPADRRLLMLADARAALLLVEGTGTDTAAPATATVLDVAELLRTAADETGGPTGGPQPQDPAYVIYTSGSTGRPKGVVIAHRALMNFLLSMRDRPGLDENDVLLAVTTVSFDIAVLELFLPLTCGATVVLADRADAVDAEALAELVEVERVTALQATPATWRMLREIDWRPPRPMVALCGGEALPPDLGAWLADTGATAWDMYGPTETTVWSSTARIGDQGRLHDWAAVGNTVLHVLDDDLEPVLPGAAGELYIGGAGVALGYQGRPDLTGDRFVPDPHTTEPGSRLYRTGDSAVRHGDGRIEILGRLDHQVKIRGHRVEPGETEAVLAAHPTVAAAAVHPVRTAEGDLQLAAYVVGADGPPRVADLRSYLAERLPAYLVPAAYVVMDQLPLTPSGKVDRRALPAPDDGAGEDGQLTIEPRTEEEEVLAGLWARALGVPRVGVYDDFLALGGHSLVALRIVTQAREKGIDIRFRDLMARRTIAGLLSGDRACSPDDALVWFRPTGIRPPLFCVHPGGGSAHWYVHLAREIGEDQPLAAFEWPGLHGVPDHPGSVERVARRYLTELRRARPEGPYRLLGWCGASGVAWEMARYLRDDGQTVELFLLDPVVDVADRANFHDELALFWRCEELFNALAGATDETEQRRLRAEIVTILETVVDDQRGEPLSASMLDPAWRDRVRVWRQLLEIAIAHSFHPAPLRLRLLVGDELAAAAHEVIHGLSFDRYVRRWRELAAGGLEVHRVPGDHLGVLRPPQVAVLAGLLSKPMSGGER